MNVTPASIALGLASYKSQLPDMLGNPAFDFNSVFASAISYPLSDQNSAPPDMLAAPLMGGGAANRLMHAGRNMSLPNPELAFRMMTLINNKDVLYKAQFSELSQMEASVAQMRDAGQSLGSIAMTTANDSIKSGLQSFVNQYNEWVQRFNPDMRDGGLLAGTQAAQVSRYELEQSIGNIFNGAREGLHGLRDLGITVDPGTRLILLDVAKLDAVLAANKRGAVDTIQEFGANFVKSASLLNADNNFIPRQLDNLNRAIRYIADNSASLIAEFGTGDAPKPSGQVAQALAAYNQTNS